MKCSVHVYPDSQDERLKTNSILIATLIINTPPVAVTESDTAEWVWKGNPLSYENSAAQIFTVHQKTNSGTGTLSWSHSDTYNAERRVFGSQNTSVPWTSNYDKTPITYSNPLAKSWSVSWEIEEGWTWQYQLRFTMIDGKETWYKSDENPAFESRTRTWTSSYLDDATNKWGPEPGGGGGPG